MADSFEKDLIEETIEIALTQLRAQKRPATPKVSVVLTSYNHEDFLAESIDSILSQTFKDFELYIVDDGSKDRSPDIIKGYTDPRIIPILLPKNTGLAYFSHAFFSEMQGDYLAIAHSDDSWLPAKLQKQVGFLDTHNKVGACFTGVEVVDERGTVIDDINDIFVNVFQYKNMDRHNWLRKMFFQGNSLCHPSVLAKTELYAKKEMHPVGLAALPDYYKWVYLLLSHEIYVYPEQLTRFRRRDDHKNTSGDTLSNHNRLRFESQKVLELYKKISAEDLLIAFPETKQYLVNDKISVPFALAKLLLDDRFFGVQHKMGLDILYALLQDEKQRAKIYSLYRYTHKDYFKETAEFDIYNVLPQNRIQYSTIYWHYDEGFSESIKKSQTSFIAADGSFFLSYDFSDQAVKSGVKDIRFDPDEGRFRKIRIEEVKINGKNVGFEAVNGIPIDPYDYFITLDPIYHFELPNSPDFQLKTVEIRGFSQELSDQELEVFLQAIE